MHGQVINLATVGLARDGIGSLSLFKVVSCALAIPSGRFLFRNRVEERNRAASRGSSWPSGHGAPATVRSCFADDAGPSADGAARG